MYCGSQSPSQTYKGLAHFGLGSHELRIEALSYLEARQPLRAQSKRVPAGQPSHRGIVYLEQCLNVGLGLEGRVGLGAVICTLVHAGLGATGS